MALKDRERREEKDNNKIYGVNVQEVYRDYPKQGSIVAPLIHRDLIELIFLKLLPKLSKNRGLEAIGDALRLRPVWGKRFFGFLVSGFKSFFCF